jgi:hypothetical protein
MCSSHFAPLDIFQRLDLVLQRERNVVWLCHRHVTWLEFMGHIHVSSLDNIAHTNGRHLHPAVTNALPLYLAALWIQHRADDNVLTWHHNLHLHDVARPKMISA